MYCIIIRYTILFVIEITFFPTISPLVFSSGPLLCLAVTRRLLTYDLWTQFIPLSLFAQCVEFVVTDKIYTISVIFADDVFERTNKVTRFNFSNPIRICIDRYFTQKYKNDIKIISFTVLYLFYMIYNCRIDGIIFYTNYHMQRNTTMYTKICTWLFSISHAELLTHIHFFTVIIVIVSIFI